MKRGDLVIREDENLVGIVVELKNDNLEIPPACLVMWEDGRISGKWWDDLKIINKSDIIKR
jgi:hypothetical protein